LVDEWTVKRPWAYLGYPVPGYPTCSFSFGGMRIGALDKRLLSLWRAFETVYLFHHPIEGNRLRTARHLVIRCTPLGLVWFYLNPYGLMGIEEVSIPSKSKSLSIRINPFQSIWIGNNRTSP
jgi:hypothetical protein